MMVGIGLTTVLSGVGRLLQKRPNLAQLISDSANRAVTVRQPISSWRVIYGSLGQVGGIITFMHVEGTSNEFLHLVITLAGHKLHAINTMYFDGVAVPLDGSGNATGNYAGFVFVEKNLGTTTQSAFADLVAKSGGKWTSAHKQLGRAGVHVRLKFDQNKFPNGIPNITFDVQGKEVYDPRTNAAGFSNNAALCIADYLTTKDYGLNAKTQFATRMQTSGGSALTKSISQVVTPSVNAQDYELLCFVENIGTKDAQLNMRDTAGSLGTVPVLVKAGTKGNVYQRVTGDGVANIQFCVQSTSVGDSLDLLLFNPIIRRAGLDENLLASQDFTTGFGTLSGSSVTVTQGHLASVEIDRAALITAANICDEAVTLKAGGTEARYTCNGAFETSTVPSEIIAGMLSAMAGRLVYSGGVFQIFAGSYLTPTATVTDGDFRGPMSLTLAKSKRDLYNGVKGVYVSPLNNWQPSDFPPFQNAAYVDEDGEEMWADVEMPFTTSAPTAQRLAKIQLERNRRQITGVLPLKLSKYGISTLDVIQITHSRFGWTNKTFEVVSLNLVQDSGGSDGALIGVDVSVQETDSNVYVWTPSVDEQNVDAFPAVNPYDPTQVGSVSSLAVAAAIVTTPDGVQMLKGRLSWTSPADEFVLAGGRIHIYVKKHSDANYLQAGVVSGREVSFDVPLILSGVAYDYQVICENIHGVLGSAVTLSNQTVNSSVSGMLTYRPLTNPLTAHDAGATATINVGSFTMRIQGIGDVSINSGAITGLSFNTLYFIYYDDDQLAGGAVTFVATTTKETTLDGNGRFFVGSILTPIDGFADTGGNNDGGSGAQSGMLNRVYLTQISQSLFGNAAVANGFQFADSDERTSAELSATANGSNNFGTLRLTGGAGMNRRYTSATLNILYSVPTNTTAGGPAGITVAQVLGCILGSDGNLYDFLDNTALTVNIPQGGGTVAKTKVSIAIPPGTNLNQVCAVLNVLFGNTASNSGQIKIDGFLAYLELVE